MTKGTSEVKKRMMVAVFAAVVICVVLKAVESDRSGTLIGAAVFAFITLLALGFQLLSVWKAKPPKDISELGDDDDGIDWRADGAGDEVVNVWNGWAVLLNDVAVYEAKAAAEKLESAHVRCRLELLKEDRGFHYLGNGGMGTRMCVLVAPSDYDAARKLLSRKGVL